MNGSAQKTPTTWVYVRPTDSLFVRGNLAFGDSGEHGASLMPPPPSLFAGAFRSALLGQDADQLAAFVQHGQCNDPAVAQCLGTPQVPGDFRLTWLSMAGQAAGAGTRTAPEAISPLPADLLVLGSRFATLAPRAVPNGVQSAGDLPMRPTLVSAKQEKPKGGVWLRQRGLAQHLLGQLPADSTQLESKHLYQRDPRLGIGLNADARTAEDGLIYTTEGFAFSPCRSSSENLKAKSDTGALSASSVAIEFESTGFLVGLAGVHALLPEQGVLRLGGDGRSAHYRRVDFNPPATADAPGKQGRFRLVLQTPAIFTQGWLPDGVARQADGGHRLQVPGFSARLACAALGRREVVSGWDLHQWAPKPAQAAVPAGSVYWFDQFEGSPDKLAAWVQNGMCPHDSAQQRAPQQHIRRAEGYNCALLAAWS